MNPCPCGYYGDPDHECTCSQQLIQNYQKKISGPLLDRIDLFVQVSRVPQKDLVRGSNERLAAKYRQEILAATEREVERQNKFNANLTNKELKSKINFDKAASDLLLTATDKLKLSARSYFKVMRVAATIADLNQHNTVQAADAAEALQYRQMML